MQEIHVAIKVCLLLLVSSLVQNEMHYQIVPHDNTNSPGKLPFYRNRIARKFLTPQCINMMSPNEHTKSPKKSEVGKYG